MPLSPVIENVPATNQVRQSFNVLPSGGDDTVNINVLNNAAALVNGTLKFEPGGVFNTTGITFSAPITVEWEGATIVHTNTVPGPLITVQGSGSALRGFVTRGHVKLVANPAAKGRTTALFFVTEAWDNVFGGTIEICGGTAISDSVHYASYGLLCQGRLGQGVAWSLFEKVNIHGCQQWGALLDGMDVTTLGSWGGNFVGPLTFIELSIANCGTDAATPTRDMTTHQLNQPLGGNGGGGGLYNYAAAGIIVISAHLESNNGPGLRMGPTANGCQIYDWLENNNNYVGNTGNYPSSIYPQFQLDAADTNLGGYANTNFFRGQLDHIPGNGGATDNYTSGLVTYTNHLINIGDSTFTVPANSGIVTNDWLMVGRGIGIMEVVQVVSVVTAANDTVTIVGTFANAHTTNDYVGRSANSPKWWAMGEWPIAGSPYQNQSPIFTGIVTLQRASSGQITLQVQKPTDAHAGLQIDSNGNLILGNTTNTPIFALTADASGRPSFGGGPAISTSATAGANGDVPAQVAGYFQAYVAGTLYKIPLYLP